MARSPRILVIDDVRTTRDRVRGVLTADGYEIVEASDGRQAAAALATTSGIDMIILDLVMPEMNGWEFRQFQLRQPLLARIPTLILSVKTLGEHDRYALRVGSATVLHKPFEDRDFLAAINRILAAPRQPDMAESGVVGADASPLFWSRHGRVACLKHVPPAGSSEWVVDRWVAIPTTAGKGRVRYACEECEGRPLTSARKRPVT